MLTPSDNGPGPSIPHIRSAAIVFHPVDGHPTHALIDGSGYMLVPCENAPEEPCDWLASSEGLLLAFHREWTNSTVAACCAGLEAVANLEEFDLPADLAPAIAGVVAAFYRCGARRRRS